MAGGPGGPGEHGAALPARRIPAQRVPAGWMAAQQEIPAPASVPPQVPSLDGGAGERGLPRRRPGSLLAPEVAAPPPPKLPAPVAVDPEAVRARLSAFAEGVSAANRRTGLPPKVTKDR